MKTRNIFIGIAAVAAIIILIIIWPWEDKYDLGRLENTQHDPSLTYCSYTIDQVDCENPFYSVGDTVCIECCVTRTPKPWPKRVGTNNNCPRQIVFTSADGTCEYGATRINQACSTCASAKGYYRCPNP